MRGGEGNNLFMSNCGLLQGESTSPILFSLFINDLELFLDNSQIGTTIQGLCMKLLMFADDAAIFSETREGLQAGLDNLHSFCSKWGLIVNVNKTKVVVFRKGGKLSSKDVWYYGNKLVETVPSLKYLGFNLSSSGSFANCIQDLTTSARRALFGIKCCLDKYPELPPALQLKLFNRLIEPILSYGGVVWGLSKADPIEKLHLSFLKNILGVKSSTPNCFVYGELGVFPLFLKRQVSVIKYWLKLIRGDGDCCSPLLKAVYNEMIVLSIEEPTAVTWVSLVTGLLFKIGLGNFWVNQYVVDEGGFISMFKQRVQDIFLQNWGAEVSLTSDNRLFKHIKVTFNFEPYLRLDNKAFRIAITKIRLSSHPFMIERARWNARVPDVGERVCTQCNVVENEYHCLFVCPRFVNERMGCVPNIMMQCHNPLFQFYNFLSSNDESNIYRLGRLCYNVLKTYKQELFENE